MVGERPAAHAGYVPRNLDRYGGHELLLRLCGTPTAVLDVGGSSGYVSGELQRRGARVVVVDADREAVAAAREAGLEALCVDLGRDAVPLAPASFDLLLCADVLEHLPDPPGALRRLRGLLVPGGRLVASVPNGANWAIRLSLLAGRWEYRDRGLLDRTHLRVFTRRSFHRLVTEAGFTIEATEVTCPVPVLRGGRVSALAHGAARLSPGLLGYQHLVAARLTT